MNTAIDKSIYGQIKTKGEQLAELAKMAEDIQNNNDKNAAEAYQAGLNDMWDAVKKISLMTSAEAEKVFAGAGSYNRYNLGYSGVEAMDAYKAYLEKKDRIEVGDEVTPKRAGWKGVVIGIDDDNAMVMTSDGYSAMYQIEILCKTGRHFDIASILKEMRND